MGPWHIWTELLRKNLSQLNGIKLVYKKSLTFLPSCFLSSNVFGTLTGISSISSSL